MLAQLIAIVDLFDAVTTRRPYRDARSQPAAIACLLAEAAQGWKRRDLVEAFVRLIETSETAATALKRAGWATAVMLVTTSHRMMMPRGSCVPRPA